jgi:hypothetical protein
MVCKINIGFILNTYRISHYLNVSPFDLPLRLRIVESRKGF